MNPVGRFATGMFGLILIGLPLWLTFSGMPVWEAVIIPWGSVLASGVALAVLEALFDAEDRWRKRREGP